MGPVKSRMIIENSVIIANSVYQIISYYSKYVGVQSWPLVLPMVIENSLFTTDGDLMDVTTQHTMPFITSINFFSPTLTISFNLSIVSLEVIESKIKLDNAKRLLLNT